MWDRATLESVPQSYWPHVRCEFRGVPYRGRIVPDGNNPWVVICPEGKCMEQRLSYGLILAVLNDPREAPIHFGEV